MKRVIMGVLFSVTAVSSQALLAGVEADYAACGACHNPPAAAALGAPGLGDKAAWAPRIAKGMDVLYSTAINGSVLNPVMMPRGGTALSDDALKAVVDYMVEQSK